MQNDNIRRTFFLPRCWLLKDIMYPQQSVSECLLTLHDEEGERGDGAEEEYDQVRWELLLFSEELEQPVTIDRSPDGDVIFAIDLDGIPLGMRHEIREEPTLREILEIAWDVVAECTLETDSWMSNWYTTHVVIKRWAGRNTEDQVAVRCVRAN